MRDQAALIRLRKRAAIEAEHLFEIILTRGQLSDDWQELQAILSGEREPVGRGLVWLAAVLRRYGEELVG